MATVKDNLADAELDLLTLVDACLLLLLFSLLVQIQSTVSPSPGADQTGPPIPQVLVCELTVLRDGPTAMGASVRALIQVDGNSAETTPIDLLKHPSQVVEHGDWKLTVTACDVQAKDPNGTATIGCRRIRVVCESPEYRSALPLSLRLYLRRDELLSAPYSIETIEALNAIAERTDHGELTMTIGNEGRDARDFRGSVTTLPNGAQSFAWADNPIPSDDGAKLDAYAKEKGKATPEWVPFPYKSYTKLTTPTWLTRYFVITAHVGEPADDDPLAKRKLSVAIEPTMNPPLELKNLTLPSP